jgi:hypothetical protein
MQLKAHLNLLMLPGRGSLFAAVAVGKVMSQNPQTDAEVRLLGDEWVVGRC